MTSNPSSILPASFLLLLSLSSAGCATANTNGRPIQLAIADFHEQGGSWKSLEGGFELSGFQEGNGLGLQGEITKTLAVTVQSANSSQTYYLDRATMEPIAKSNGKGIIFFRLHDLDLDEVAPFMAFKAAGTDIVTHRKYPMNFMGKEGVMEFLSDRRVMVDFPVQSDSVVLDQRYDVTFDPTSLAPLRVRSGLTEERTATARMQTIFEARTLETGKPFVVESRSLNASAFGVSSNSLLPWRQGPSSEGGRDMDFAFSESVGRAKEGSSRVKEFFTKHPESYLAGFAYDSDSVNFGIAMPAVLSWSWTEKWLADGEQLEFKVTLSAPGPLNLPQQYNVSGVDVKDAPAVNENARLDMVAIERGYAACKKLTDGAPALVYQFEDLGQPPSVPVVGGQQLAPHSTYYCAVPGSISWALDAYSGLLAAQS